MTDDAIHAEMDRRNGAVPDEARASDYAYPLDLRELLKELAYGTACQMPTRMAEKVGQVLESFTATADLRVRFVEVAGARRLQLIPLKVELNDWGKKFVEGKMGDERTLLDGKLPPPHMM
jgi:hypothetical protein